MEQNEPMIDELLYETSVDANRAIMRAMTEITFLERMKPIMAEVARELVKAGVDFSHAQSDTDNSKYENYLPVRGRNDQTNTD